MMKKITATILITVIIVAGGYVLPERFTLPVEDMNNHSFNHQSFWFYPWGASIIHKGVDVFAPKGKDVYASTSGIVIQAGTHHRGGKMILILGPKWRIHHFLHLNTLLINKYTYVHCGDKIGKVGNSGNAINKPSHLHYAITTPIPYLWQANTGIQGWKKIWYVDPTPYLLKQSHS